MSVSIRQIHPVFVGEVSGIDIARPLTADEVAAIDEGMKWMVDFDAAEEKGMGIRARLSQQAAAGLDFLLVLGVKDSAGGTTDWTPRLAELFDAHRYTDGLSFVPQGTPSNNTADAPSGFSSADPGHEASYLAELATPIFQPGDWRRGWPSAGRFAGGCQSGGRAVA